VRVTVHLRGVGGQALPFIVTMLGRRAADANVQMTSREVFGMAQRGGSVFAILDIETPQELGSEREPARTVLLGLELLEGLRGFGVLRPGERAFVSTARVIPPGSWAFGTAAYPTVEEITSIAERFGIDLTLVDAPVNAPWRVVQAAIDSRAIPLLGARVGVTRS
jgi:indolepyruvate ferredoxin oxidoreductase, beta subunit